MNKKNNLKKILSYEVLSETEWNENEKSFSPNYFVNLSKYDINQKIKSFLKTDKIITTNKEINKVCFTSDSEIPNGLPKRIE